MAAMRELSELMLRVEETALGVAEPLAIKHLARAARKFCQKTRCWRDVDSFTSDGDESGIFSLPPFTELYQIEWATFNRVPLKAVPYDVHMGLIDESGYEDEPRYITQISPDSVKLLPMSANTKGDFKISAFLMPMEGAELVPDFMIAQWGDELVAGALSTLLLLPNVPFANADLAMLNAQRFQQALDDNFNHNRRGQQRGSAKNKYSFF